MGSWVEKSLLLGELGCEVPAALGSWVVKSLLLGEMGGVVVAARGIGVGSPCCFGDLGCVALAAWGVCRAWRTDRGHFSGTVVSLVHVNTQLLVT